MKMTLFYVKCFVNSVHTTEWFYLIFSSNNCAAFALYLWTG